ncbi:sodium:calcium antiporter [Candidatus Woesearchaeota archaeon]|nr:sodium:calcium antiporter [Candidatus Woesearchaeota archaeon]
MLLYNVIGFAAAVFVMVKAGSYAVRYISSIAKEDKISVFLTSFLLIGVVSAFPEGFISVVSALKGEPALGFGTLLGGNIADLSLVLGIIAVAAGSIRIHNREFAHDFWLVGLVMLPVLFSLDGTVGRLEGFALVAACLMFIFGMLREDRVLSKLAHSPKGAALKNLALFAVSSSVVLVAANFVVNYAEGLAADLSIPIALIGIVFIGVTTTLPELMFSLAAVKKHMGSLALGDVFGTVVIDATLLTGITALINPVHLVGVNIINLATFSALAVSASIFFLKPGKVFTRNQGVLLIVLYVIFVATELATSLR